MPITDQEEFAAEVASSVEVLPIWVWNGNGYKIQTDLQQLAETAQAVAAQWSISFGNEYPGGLEPIELQVGERFWEVWAGRSTYADPVRIEFKDDSEIESWCGPLCVDDGAALLDPISAAELAGIEPILAELWRAIDGGLLTPAQEHQIIAMAELLRDEHSSATAEDTKRWKLAGPLRACLRYLLRHAPRDALAWMKIVDLLEKIGWSSLATELRL